MPDYDLISYAELLSQKNDMRTMRPVIEKELLHYEILSALEKADLLSALVFQGGTCLRLCYGADRYSEDLDFIGGKDFSASDLNDLKTCLEATLCKKFNLLVEVQEPNMSDSLVLRWRIKINTFPERPDLPVQKISFEVAAVPAYTKKPRMLLLNYEGLSSSYADTIVYTESLEEILADKLESFVCANHIRYRDIWDIYWLSRQKNLDFAQVYDLRKLKEKDYRESEKFSSGFVRVTEQLATIVESREFQEQMRRFLPNDLFEKTLYRQVFREVLTETIGTLYADI